MKNDAINNYPSYKLIVILSFAISVLVQTEMFLAFYFSNDTFTGSMIRPRPEFHLDGFVLNLVYIFIITLSLYLYCMFIQNKAMSDKKKLIYIILGLIVNTIILSLIFTILHPLALSIINGYQFQPIDSMRFHIYGLVRDFFVAVIVAFSWEIMVLNNKRQNILIENEKLIAENHITRYEALKNQTNPHFLFNSLNTLQSLIRMDQTKAEDYVQQLSKVLRYTLQNDEVVTLQEEVRLANSFCKLMQTRYGNNLKFNFDIDERLMQDEIIPLSLQILIENAIKHNVISDKQPLDINVVSDYKSRKIVVENKIQQKIDKCNGNGIGLANLSERYKLKWDSDIEITIDDVSFRVALKLNNVK